MSDSNADQQEPSMEEILASIRRIISEDEEEESAGFEQSSSIYEIHKILSSDQYTIGKSVSDYIESFHLQYKNLQKVLLILPFIISKSSLYE